MEANTDSTTVVTEPKVEATKGAVAPPIADAQLRGEIMAYAAQSALCSLGGNLVEPYINHRVQKRFGPEDAVTHKVKFGSYGQNLAGEFAGDIAGAGTLMALEMLAPEMLHSNSRKLRKLVDPLYDSVAHRVFRSQEGSPDYQQKVDEWKTFQERNLVRSLIIATGGIAGNLAAQKLLIGNPAPTGLIFAGKLLSTSVTMGLGLCTRFAFPKQMDALDERLSKKYFEPMFRKEGALAPANEKLAKYAEKLRKEYDDFVPQYQPSR